MRGNAGHIRWGTGLLALTLLLSGPRMGGAAPSFDLTVGDTQMASTVLGTASGSVAGYYGGMWDSLILRLVDMLLAFPGILLALAIVAMLGPNLVNTMIAVGISSTPYYTRVTRSVVLASKEREKVAAARALGATDARIVVVRSLLTRTSTPCKDALI